MHEMTLFNPLLIPFMFTSLLVFMLQSYVKLNNICYNVQHDIDFIAIVIVTLARFFLMCTSILLILHRKACTPCFFYVYDVSV